MTENQIVILGGGYAGLMAAARLSGRTEGREVLLLNDSAVFKERIRNHEIAAGNHLNKKSIRSMLPQNVRFKEGRMKRIFPERNCVEIESGGRLKELSYSVLLCATGSSSGYSVHMEKIHTIDSEKGALRLHQSIIENPSAVVAVMGAGLSGIELASELKEKFPRLRIHLFDTKEIGSQFSSAGKKYVRTILESMGVILHDGCKMTMEDNGKFTLPVGAHFHADVFVNTGGFKGNSPGKASGLPVNAAGQVLVDSFLRVNHYPNIFFCGDCAWIEGDDYISQRMGCAFAMPMGAHAAENLIRFMRNESLLPFGFKFAVQCVSLGRKRGFIQTVSGDDRPLEKIFTGRIGAVIKELVCKYTVWILHLEKFSPFRIYSWPGSNPKIKMLKHTKNNSDALPV